MKDRLKIFFQEKTVSLSIKISLVSLGMTFIFFALIFKKLPPYVPVFYSLPWGEEQLGKSLFLLILPIGSFLFGILNFSLAILVFEKQPLATKILVWATTLLIFLTTLTLIKIVLLVT